MQCKDYYSIITLPQRSRLNYRKLGQRCTPKGIPYEVSASAEKRVKEV
jgi:hypothetical protein